MRMRIVIAVLLGVGGGLAVGCGGGAATEGPANTASTAGDDVRAMCTKVDSLSQAKDQTCAAWLGGLKRREGDVFACFTKCVDGAASLDAAVTCTQSCPKSMVAARMAVLREAIRSLGTIESVSKDKYKASEGSFCGASSPDPRDSGGNPQPGAVPRATTAAGDWSGGLWKCLKFSPAAPTQCQYDYSSAGRGPQATFTATATCDHDGDGKGTFITLKEKVDDKGQVVRDSLVVTGDDDE
jgi:hypothetical protein